MNKRKSLKRKIILLTHKQVFCPMCGKLHYVKKLNTNNYRCSICDKIYKQKKREERNSKRRKYINYQRRSPLGTWKCKICGEIFSTRKELQQHNKQQKHSRAKSLNYYNGNIFGDFFCQYCGRHSTTKNGLTLHEKYCELNPNKIVCKGHPVPQSLREQISLKQKENYANGKNRWHIDRSKTPYSEKYFIDWLNKENIEFNHNYKVSRFYLDFAFPNSKKYFEVNGEQHYQKDINGKDYVLRDEERKNFLENLDWNCIETIRWSEFKKLSIKEKENFLNSLKQKII